MSIETCTYCLHHAWHDEKRHHVCLRAGGEGGEMSCLGECDRFTKDRRGTYGCPDHVNEYDLDEIEGDVKDDKYTKKKGK